MSAKTAANRRDRLVRIDWLAVKIAESKRVLSDPSASEREKGEATIALTRHEVELRQTRDVPMSYVVNRSRIHIVDKRIGARESPPKTGIPVDKRVYSEREAVAQLAINGAEQILGPGLDCWWEMGDMRLRIVPAAEADGTVGPT